MTQFPVAGSVDKEPSWVVAVCFGVTRRVPIAIVIARTGKHPAFVMLNGRSIILRRRRFLRDL
jgi:hypothetical protein